MQDGGLSVRKSFAKIVGAPSHHCIFTAPSTSFAITLAAENISASGALSAGKIIIVMEGEMESNVYPWQHACQSTGAALVIVPYPSPEETMTDALCRTLASYPPASIAVVALSMVHWCSGEVIDIQGIISLCAERILYLKLYV